MVLYNYYRSSTSYRARIALYHKQLTFEYKPVHLINLGGEQNSGDYKKLNPMSEVPTLVHGKNILAQSMVIIQYLDEVFPNNPLFPDDPFQRAQVRQLCENINCGIHPIQNLKVMQKLEGDFSATEAQKKAWIQFWIKKGFQAQEGILKKTAGTFCFGDSITAADLFLIPQVFSAQRFEVPLDEFSRIIDIVRNCLELEAFKKAHPQNQPDTPLT